MSAPPFPCVTEDNDVCWPCEWIVNAIRYEMDALDLTKTQAHREICVVYHIHDPAFWREPGRLVAPPSGRPQEEQECPF